MLPPLALACALGAIAPVAALPEIFGEPGAESPVPRNTARYLLDLEAQNVYLHYCGGRQLFTLRFSRSFKRYLEKLARKGSSGQMPVVYPVNELSPQGTVDWAAASIPRWSRTSGADARHVFYGREVRDAKEALYGNSIHLSLGPEDDPEGWTPDEMNENRKFAEAIRGGMPVAAADQYRQFRHGIAAALGGRFAQRFGHGVTTKAHRFALQMYTADSQSEANKPGRLFFEMFPGGRPPTENVMFVEAEDGCKGTPTPPTKWSQGMQKVDARGTPSLLFSKAAGWAEGKLVTITVAASMSILASLAALRRLRAEGGRRPAAPLAEREPGE